MVFDQATTQHSVSGMGSSGESALILSRGFKSLAQVRVTLLVVICTLLASLIPTLGSFLELDFQLASAGQWWRMITGHLTHFGGQHLFWDLLMFMVLASLCEMQNRRSFAVLLALMGMVVSGTVFFCCNDVACYRGLSGIDTGLFVWFVGDQYRLCRKSGDHRIAIFWGSMMTLLLGKLIFEMFTGQLLFVRVEGFKPLVESHVSGGFAGLLALFISKHSAFRDDPQA